MLDGILSTNLTIIQHYIDLQKIQPIYNSTSMSDEANPENHYLESFQLESP